MTCLEINLDQRTVVVRTEDGREMGELNLDDLAELVEFRYATPWNVTKDSLEKVALIWKTLCT